MRNAAIILLVLSIGALGILLYSQNATLREQRRQVEELNRKLESMSKTTALSLQEKCATQAHEAFKLLGWDKEKTASFANHYNEKLNKCFVQIENTTVKPGNIFTSKTLSDAFEGRLYGEYNWFSDGTKKYWEVRPVACKVTLPSGEETVCHSSEEFDTLIKQYME